ncbi:MAG: hypothetical protein H7645_05600 [Candidatus Heimdallarchaeota archaeon]|nr:hypothetical protein [Candidatus Heimdallarchaeota archaeon]MCK4769798.1 hypothetical protein [Candidatus Heimdallarchaeota archaeon]
MNTRARIYLIFFLSIGIIFLLIAIVHQQVNLYETINTFTETQVKDFLNTYVAGFPRPWA